jgi:L-ascorbate metabolism protein UlaG (beta-lactamase superfamily)
MTEGVELLGNLHWLGHASFRLDGPPTIYFDPYELAGDLPVADLILVTHEHYDHCSPADIEKVAGPQTVIVAGGAAAGQLRGDVRRARPGDTLKIGKVEVKVVPAYNVGKRFHPKRAGHVGFIVSIGDERLYFAGDTDRIPEMREIACDVALLPVGGTYTMDAGEAAQAAADIGPSVAVPMHYGSGIGTAADGERFRSAYVGKTVVLEPD